jgi:hypothetical protein
MALPINETTTSWGRRPGDTTPVIGENATFVRPKRPPIRFR